VPAQIQKAYQPASLAGYRFSKRVLIRAGAALSYLLVRIIGKTLRYQVEGLEYLEEIRSRGHQPIYCFWHNRILAGTYFFRGREIVVMTSQSEDGEYIARFINKFGYGTVRGSSTRGGIGALVELIRLMKEGSPAAFTVDGPRGPKYEAKLGPVMLAKKTGNPMLPFSLECRRFWRVGSWDDLQIPKPFSRVLLVIARPIYVEADGLDESLEEKRLQLQQSLDRLVERGRKWREEI
jgi:lysophospholipid acyltransferase (LPLAT)-like uncharacterized protein